MQEHFLYNWKWLDDNNRFKIKSGINTNQKQILTLKNLVAETNGPLTIAVNGAREVKMPDDKIILLLVILIFKILNLYRPYSSIFPTP